MVRVAPDSMRDTLAAVMRGDTKRTIAPFSPLGCAKRWRRDRPFVGHQRRLFRNQATIRMLEFRDWLDRQFISSASSDGMIITSPTGRRRTRSPVAGRCCIQACRHGAGADLPHTLSDRRSSSAAGSQDPAGDAWASASARTATFDGQYNRNCCRAIRSSAASDVPAAALIHPRGSTTRHLPTQLRWGRGPSSAL